MLSMLPAVWGPMPVQREFKPRKSLYNSDEAAALQFKIYGNEFKAAGRILAALKYILIKADNLGKNLFK